MDGAGTAGLRDRLVDQLVAAGRMARGPVEAAFRAVPRHLFVPGVDPALAYADQAVVTDRDGQGRPVSSSSQPSVMALMLGQLGVQPGQRVLEIGAGTGYNAALLAELVGESGRVISVDIDAGVLGRARRHLDSAGYARVELAHGDGARGWPADAPYDRIMLTVGAWDIAPAWVHQLADGGRLLVPLSLRGTQRSIAFEQTDGALASVSIVDCGFMPMRGELAGPAARPLTRPGVFLHVDDDRRIDADAVQAALERATAHLVTGMQVSVEDVHGGLDLWLSLHEPDTARLIALDPAADQHVVPALISYPGMSSTIGLLGQRSLAVLVRHDAGRDNASFGLDIHGYGPEGGALVDRLAAHLRAWDRHGSPSSAELDIRAYPRSDMPSAAPGTIVVTKPHTQLVIGWRDRPPRP